MQLLDNFIFIERNVKHARLRVSEDGRIRVIIPLNFSKDDVDALIKKKQRWIDKNLKFFDGMSKIELQRNQVLLYGNRYGYFYDSTYETKVIIDHEHKSIRAKRNLLDIPTQEKWLRGIAKRYLTERAEKLSESLCLKYNRLFIRNQKRKWGNCSNEKNISLNWRLIKAPVFVIDYLIVHELIHTIAMKHTHKFWTLLKSHYPDYKEAVKWLEKYGNNL
ncbi:MAG: SprT family zinc-dependent metalloprotease [Desulfosalsimonadaceae bacterium]